MPGILGNRQDFTGNGELHPDWDKGESWQPYYAYFTDPLRNPGDPFYKFNNGVNYSSCPEMDCIPPEQVVASVQGFNSKTRIPPGFVLDFYNFRYDLYRSQDCYAFGGCDPFEEYTPSCYGWPDGIVFSEVAGRFINGDAYDPCVILYDIGATPGTSYPWTVFDFECMGWSGVWFEWAASANHPVLWPSIAFHNSVPLSCDISYIGNGIQLNSFTDLSDIPSSVPGYYQSNNSNNIEYSYPNFFNPGHIYDGSIYGLRNFTWSEIDGDGTLDDILTRPPNTWSYYGQSEYNPDNYNIFFDDDHNGVYYCYRDNGTGSPALGLRPELIAFINKTNDCSSVGTVGTIISDVDGGACFVADSGELIFEVGGREQWSTAEICCLRDGVDEQISGFDFSTGEEIPPEDAQPDGLFYGVDYACGPRRASYLYRDDEGELLCNDCYRFYCDERLGMAKPHLAAYPIEHENTTAQLKLNLQPNQWMFIHGTKSTPDGSTNINYLNPGNAVLNIDNLKDMDAVPYTWRVDSVDIISAGSGYTTDMYFYVDFDVNWFLPWLGGQGISIFPDEECCIPGCLLLEPISWSDKYGYSKLVGNNVVYQRLKITEVGLNGEIQNIEIVPWFKNPEYKNPYIDDETGEQIWSLCQDTNKISDPKKKTPYYIEYFRLLCHPNSVRHPGKNYSIGDTIIWEFPEEKNTAKAAIYDTWNNKKAVGIVVDVDENGGILDWYISGSDRWKQYGVFNLVDGTPCYEYANEMQYYTGINQTLERDDRGRYRFLGYNLCDLTYSGNGNTVRSCTINGINTSTTTLLNLNIERVNCKTTATIFINPWPFSDQRIALVNGEDFIEGQLAEGSIGFYKSNFPPYPVCQGGGFESDIVYGLDRANDSVFGSTVKDAIIISSGIGYAFKDKKHVEPILPNTVPKLFGILVDQNENPINTQIDEPIIVGITVGKPAVLDYSFEKISNFPHPDVINNFSYNNGFSINSDRFAYFKVNNINIVEPGSGYSVGLSLDVYPENGQAFTDPWSLYGGDHPDINPSGSWYDGKFAKTDQDGYLRYDKDASNNTIPFDTEQFVQQYPYLTFEIDGVGESGDITSLKIINSGTMYRSVWTSGAVHPDIMPELISSLGYGAVPQMSVNTNINNKDFFGSVTDFWFRGATEAELPDPYFNSGTIPGNSAMGFGRDYASPEHGYYWILQDVNIGINGDVHLLAHYDWGINHNAAYGYTPIHYLGENSLYQTYKTVAGSVPAFVPKTTVCSFAPCYHELLNRSYPLYRSYYALSQWSSFDCSATAQPFVGDATYPSGPPGTAYGVLLRKFRQFIDGSFIPLQTVIYNEGDCTGDIIGNPETGETVGPGTVSLNAGGTSIGSQGIYTSVDQDYYVIEYGMTLDLSAANATTEFRHVNGRTTRGDGGSTIPSS